MFPSMFLSSYCGEFVCLPDVSPNDHAVFSYLKLCLHIARFCFSYNAYDEQNLYGLEKKSITCEYDLGIWIVRYVSCESLET